MGHKIKNYETGEMCMIIKRVIRFAYLKKTDGQGKMNLNLKMMIVTWIIEQWCLS